MKSGDLSVIDEGGYLTIVGRNKDVINRGGKKISSKTIEDHILGMDNVENVQVVAVSDEKYGEEILALIKRTDSSKLFDIHAVKKELKDKLAHFKISKYIWVVADLPITVTGNHKNTK